MNYFPDNQNAVGLDYEVDQLKKLISQIPLSGTMYGRVVVVPDRDMRRIPAVLKDSRGNFIPLTPDDRVDMFGFIDAVGTIRPVDGFSINSSNVMEAELDLVFFGNLLKVVQEPTHVDTHLISAMVVSKLKEWGAFTVESILEQSRAVFRKYDFDFEDRYEMFPYFCFKINGILNFQEDANKSFVHASLGITNGFGPDQIKIYDGCNG